MNKWQQHFDKAEAERARRDIIALANKLKAMMDKNAGNDEIVNDILATQNN